MRGTARLRLVRVPRTYSAWRLGASCPAPLVRTAREAGTRSPHVQCPRGVRVNTGRRSLLGDTRARRRRQLSPEPLVLGLQRRHLRAPPARAGRHRGERGGACGLRLPARAGRKARAPGQEPLQAAHQRTSAALLAPWTRVAASVSSAARPLPTAAPTASRSCGTPPSSPNRASTVAVGTATT